MKQLPSSAAWVFMLLGLTLTGCATTPPPPEKPKTLKTVKPAVTSQAVPTQPPSPKVLVTPSVSRAIPKKKEATQSTWYVTVLQNGVALENTDDKIPLKKAPFSIRLTLPTPQAVQFTAASTPPDLEASHLDIKLKALCTPVIYMTLWVDNENRLVFDRGELKQLALFFVS